MQISDRPHLPQDELAYLSATEMARKIRAREVSPVELVDAVLDRIERVNGEINAFTIVLGDEAREAARRAERALTSGADLGSLHGIPLTIKDLTPTKGVRTTYCSRAYADFVPDESALSVDRLLGAGGIMIGKTTSPEFGLKGVTDSPLMGTTNNPWKTTHIVGGSSGGAAASVAAGMGPLAHGSDWAGSVRIPASCCGVVGFKPSFGRIPVYEPPIAQYHTIGHDGPLARTVEDVALMTNAWAGPDMRDPFCLDDTVDFTAALREPSVRGVRVAFSRDLGLGPVDREVAQHVGRAAELFASELGANVEEATPQLPDPHDRFMDLWTVECLMTLEDLLLPRIDVSEVDPVTVHLAERGRSVGSLDFARGIYVMQGEVYDAMMRFFGDYDLLLTPTITVPPFPHPTDLPGPTTVDGQPIDPMLGWLLTYPFNITGQPAISVPCGFSQEGLPIGLQIVGGRHQDVAVLRAAAAYQEAVPWMDRYPC